MHTSRFSFLKIIFIISLLAAPAAIPLFSVPSHAAFDDAGLKLSPDVAPDGLDNRLVVSVFEPGRDVEKKCGGATGKMDETARLNKKIAKIVEKYNAKHLAEYMDAIEKLSAAGPRAQENKKAFKKAGRPPDMKEMSRIGRGGHDFKGRGESDRPSAGGDARPAVTRYIPPGENIDPLFSLEQPNQPSDFFSYVGSMAFEMAMRYPVEYAKRISAEYARKNYAKQVEQIERTQKTVSDAYHKPVRAIENRISKSFFSGGTGEVRLNFFFMRSTLGVRMNY